MHGRDIAYWHSSPIRRAAMGRPQLRADPPSSALKRDGVTGEDDPMYARCHELPRLPREHSGHPPTRSPVTSR